MTYDISCWHKKYSIKAPLFQCCGNRCNNYTSVITNWLIVMKCPFLTWQYIIFLFYVDCFFPPYPTILLSYYEMCLIRKRDCLLVSVFWWGVPYLLPFSVYVFFPVLSMLLISLDCQFLISTSSIYWRKSKSWFGTGIEIWRCWTGQWGHNHLSSGPVAIHI